MKMTEKELIIEYSEKIPELLGQPKVSFLIGAGCSSCAGLPFMDGLTTQIYDRLNPDNTKNSHEKIAYQLLLEIQAGFAGLNNVSIEDYLSEIQDIDAILQRQKAKGVANPIYPPGTGIYTVEHTQLLLQKVKEAIRDILGEKIATIKWHRQFCRAIHYDLIKGRKRAKCPVNYFVLNYDTLIEDALALEGVYFNDGFIGGATAWWDTSQFEDVENKAGLNRPLDARVYKLHGSIDWFRTAESQFPMRIRKTLPTAEIIGTGEAVVIYPSSAKYKETQYDPYAQMMSNFRKHLTSTENHILAIMGYGFNDEHINIEVRNAIRNSDGALSVVVFLGTSSLPKSLAEWIDDVQIYSQILIMGKNGIWKGGNKLLTTTADLQWYKFEEISMMISGVR